MKQAKDSDQQQKTESVLSSGDRLTIETTTEFAQSIRRELDRASTVVIEFKEDVELDLTALQVFCSACRLATKEKKKFMYRGQLPQALLGLAAATGAERYEFCNYNNKYCFRKFKGE